MRFLGAGYDDDCVTEPFVPSWVKRVRFGVLAGVPLPAGLEPVSPSVLGQLHPREAVFASEERGRRQIEVAGGRLAFRAAASAFGADVSAWPLLADSARVPLGPPGLSVSLTHKEDLAIAFVGTSDAGLVGIDLEGGPRDRSAIMSRVCRPEELSAVQALPEAGRWPNVMIRFAVKEAIYKAIAPQLGRFFGFQAARVDVESKERVSITMFLEATDPTYELDNELVWLDDGRLIALVRARVSASAKP
ncbi:MAG: 4'-phosphopantetheinyl transferase superfamily protein [Archangiaceae bacterium]|nr:4'-phosphopantetheinyl transferase superfamily protein [Archangiaceae bacterium]